MNFIEAYKALIKGKKVRQLDWDKGEYIEKGKTCGNEDFYVCDSGCFSEEDGTSYELCGIDYLAEDWEIYEEECKLHTFEEALKAYKSGKKIRRKNNIMIYQNYYLDLEDVMANDWIIIDKKETK